MLNNLSCGVVICAYTLDRWTELCAAVHGVRQQTVPVQQMIVVIDHNRELLERAQAELCDVTVLANNHPQGLSGARNTGIEHCHTDIIAFMDEDAVPAPDWLENLLEPYNDPAVIGVGGAIEPRWQSEPQWLPAEFNWVVGCTYVGMPERAAPVRNLIGCNMSFRREVFDLVGGFRHDVGQVGTSMLRCDETEFCIRLGQRARNRRLFYEPRASVHHYVPDNRTRWEYFRERCYTEGLAKSQVAHLVGTQDGLSSERAYTFRTLPFGVLRNMGQGIVTLDLYAFLRAGTIVAGLGLTTMGYLKGKFGLDIRARGELRRVELDSV